MKQRSIFAKKCDWCKTELILNGKESDTYVINAERKIFCKIHTPGKEPEKDCMDEYIKDLKIKSSLIAKPKIEVTKLADKNTAIKKLNDLKQFLNKRHSYNR
jgi:hypothetical protein